MRNKHILAAAVIAVSGTVFAQQQQEKNRHIRPNSLTTVLEADPVAGAAFDEFVRPIARLETEARRQMDSGNMKEAERLCLQALAAYESKNILFAAFTRNQLGDIYVRTGQYEKAIATYLPNYKYVGHPKMNLNVALAYARLGNYRMAKQFYSDQGVLQYSSVKTEDMPGTGDPRSLEASILFARGLESFSTARRQEALVDFEAAGRLAPRNGAIPYYMGIALVYTDQRAKADPYFQKAAKFGRGKIAQDAKVEVARLR